MANSVDPRYKPSHLNLHCLHWHLCWTTGFKELIHRIPISECLLQNLEKVCRIKVITKTCLYNFDPFKPHFYIVKLEFTGVYIIFLISAQKHRLWVLIRIALPRQF